MISDANRELLCEILEDAIGDFAPGFKIVTDSGGQVIILTGLFEDKFGELSCEVYDDSDYEDDSDGLLDLEEVDGEDI